MIAARDLAHTPVVLAVLQLFYAASHHNVAAMSLVDVSIARCSGAASLLCSLHFRTYPKPKAAPRRRVYTYIAQIPLALLLPTKQSSDA